MTQQDFSQFFNNVPSYVPTYDAQGCVHRKFTYSSRTQAGRKSVQIHMCVAAAWKQDVEGNARAPRFEFPSRESVKVASNQTSGLSPPGRVFALMSFSHRIPLPLPLFF